MAVDNKHVKEFEDKYKKELFGKIGKISSQQHELITQIQNFGKCVDLESDLPNIGITFNNKLIELQHQFEDAGISIYAEYKTWGDFAGSSFVGDAIISDLINYVSKGTQNLADYDKKIKEISDKRVEKVNGLEKASLIRSFFSNIRNLFVNIRSLFVPAKQEELSYTQEEIDSVNSYLSDYRETDNQLWKYNLRDNVISSIVKEIREMRYGAYTVPGLLEESVIPDLEKLGLADLIPQLQQALIEEYKKDLPDSEIYQVKDDELYLYVPDFTRKDERTVDGGLEELHKQAKSVIEDRESTKTEAKITLEQHTISLRDFSLVDSTSNASDRQAAASAIGEELHPVQEVNRDKKQEVSEISLED